jgi:Na+-transporting NADH:ubiquinone oxidoreductase subunit A
MSLSVNLKKGLDIRMKGSAEKVLSGEMESVLYAVKPVDFPDLTPRLNVKPGDIVSAGSPS